MTSQTLIAERSSSASGPTTLPSSSDQTASLSSRSNVSESLKTPYPLDQQMKFLHLQAETETLLQQLRIIKQQREACGATSSKS